MRKIILFLALAATLLGSCGTGDGSGTFIGAHMGGMLGSAIGGLLGGETGSDVGTIFGMAGGAVIGTVIDENKVAKCERERERRHQRAMRRQGIVDDAVFIDLPAPDGMRFAPQPNNTEPADDRVYPFEQTPTTAHTDSLAPAIPDSSARRPAPVARPIVPKDIVELRHPRFEDASNDNRLTRNETGTVVFEVYNNGAVPLYDVVPVVEKTTRNKHIILSPSTTVKRIMPQRGIRYTAYLTADRWLKDGTITLKAYVRIGKRIVSAVQEFNVETHKK